MTGVRRVRRRQQALVPRRVPCASCAVRRAPALGRVAARVATSVAPRLPVEIRRVPGHLPDRTVDTRLAVRDGVLAEPELDHVTQALGLGLGLGLQ